MSILKKYWWAVGGAILFWWFYKHGKSLEGGAGTGSQSNNIKYLLRESAPVVGGTYGSLQRVQGDSVAVQDLVIR